MRPHWTTSNPALADMVRDDRDEAEALADHCRAILDAMRLTPSLFRDVTDPVALEGAVAGLEHTMHMVARDLNDGLGENA